ncbi:MAG: (deoxy)nucleoside triphosphate pyrophosphohydrolase [Acidobacteria bacterium]|nr:(deoxy)nucleoside triphosphate pyrophosphohydrolase [Acidobacteriota bacterium]
MKKTVVAALIPKQGRLFICQRSLAGAFPGKWEFPGGKVDPGESPPAALRRELEEELGIAAEIGEPLFQVEHQYPGYDPVLLIFFSVRRYTGSIENRVFERICWAAPQELPQYDFLEGDRVLIERVVGGSIVVPASE